MFASRHSHIAWLARCSAVVAALVLTATACGSSSSSDTPSQSATAAAAGPVTAAQLYAQAKKGGTIMMYSGSDPVTAATVIKGFLAAYPGLKMSFTRVVGGQGEAKYDAEAAAGSTQADIVINVDQPFYTNALQKGWMVPISAANVPNVANLPKKFIFTGNVAVGIDRLNGIAVNLAKVTPAETPKSMPDLLKPMWKGQLVTGDPATQNVFLAYWALLDKTFGDNYVKSMGGQNIDWEASLLTGMQKVASGEKLAGFGANIGHVLPIYTAAGPGQSPISKPLIITQPDTGFVWNAGVSKDGPNPDGGLLFLNWLLTPAGQKAWNTLTQSASVLPGVTIPNALPVGSNFDVLNTEVPAAVRTKILGLLGLS